MLSLGVFFLLLAEIIPPTSLAVPLLGRYLLFTMILVTLSVCVTIAVVNVNYRSPYTHKMAPWVRTIFIKFLPHILMIKRPEEDEDENENESSDGSEVSQTQNMDDSSGGGGGASFTSHPLITAENIYSYRNGRKMMHITESHA